MSGALCKRLHNVWTPSSIVIKKSINAHAMRVSPIDLGVIYNRDKYNLEFIFLQQA